MMIGMGGHFNSRGSPSSIVYYKALEESGKETFTKEDLVSIHANAIASFCADFQDKKKEEEQKAKEAELKDAGLFIKPQIS